MNKPPPSTVRGHTAAESDVRYIPGVKSAHGLPNAPIDLPDDFGLDDDRRDVRAVIWASAALVLAVVIAVIAIWGAFS